LDKEKELKEYILDLIEIEAYRTLEGQSFDFGTGVIHNDFSYGTEEAILEMQQQDLEEIIYYWGWDDYLYIKRKKKYKLNYYARKQISKIKLEKLAKVSWYAAYYSERVGRYVRCYLSGRKGYAKYCSKRVVRNRNDFPLKGNGYRRAYDYWWIVF
jgi:hypothetical protein